MKRVAIVGAGMAGCSVAYGLRTTGYAVTVFEKGRGVGGRAATRRREGARYDHGAQYYDPVSQEDQDHVSSLFQDTETVVVPPPSVKNSRTAHVKSRERWVPAGGVNLIPKTLLKESRGTLVSSVQVAHMRFAADSVTWWLIDSNKTEYGPFGAVVLTPPAPQTAEIIGGSQVPLEIRDRLFELLSTARYETVLSIVLGYSEWKGSPDLRYAFLDKNPSAALRWLARESIKPNRSDAGDIWIAQMGHKWSVEHLREPIGNLTGAVVQMASQLAGIDFPVPDWTDIQRWRYAQPFRESLLRRDLSAEAESIGLFLAGDAFSGGKLALVSADAGLLVDRLIAVLRK